MRPFYAKTLEAYRQEMTVLTTAEELKFKLNLKFLELLRSNQTEGLKELVAEMKPCSPSEFYKFCEKSTVFKDFCSSSDFPLTKQWATFLKTMNYSGEPQTSIDHTIHHDILDQYRAAYLYTDYEEKAASGDRAHALLSLDLACEFKLFDALVERCKINRETIETSKDDRERTIALGQIIIDSKLLGNLYGTVGFNHAALTFLDIGTFYKRQSDDASGILALAIHRMAAKYYYCAMELLKPEYDLPENETAIKAIYKTDKAAMDAFKASLKGDLLLKEHIGNDPVSLDKAKELALHRVQGLLQERKLHPLEYKI